MLLVELFWWCGEAALFHFFSDFVEVSEDCVWTRHQIAVWRLGYMLYSTVHDHMRFRVASAVIFWIYQLYGGATAAR